VRASGFSCRSRIANGGLGFLREGFAEGGRPSLGTPYAPLALKNAGIRQSPLAPKGIVDEPDPAAPLQFAANIRFHILFLDIHLVLA